MYQMFIEMLGIAVFGYMIGTIQTLLMGFQVKDQSAEQQEHIDLWLIKLDQANKKSVISKRLFNDVKAFFSHNFKHDIEEVVSDPYFMHLKPRLQKTILDQVFKSKYDLFAPIFEGCSVGFQRELIFNCKFKYYVEDEEEEMKIDWVPGVELPVILEAFDHSKYVYFILKGEVHVMDTFGLYDYALVETGSYFGELSIILERPNEYSYFYDPYQTRPLQMLRITSEMFVKILNKYPLEREIWIERAKKRKEMLDSFKNITLLKFMKSIIKKPDLVK